MACPGLFLRGISSFITLDEIEDIAAPYGDLKSLYLGTSEDGSRYAIVKYFPAELGEQDPVEAAVKGLNRSQFYGSRLFARRFVHYSKTTRKAR